MRIYVILWKGFGKSLFQIIVYICIFKLELTTLIFPILLRLLLKHSLPHQAGIATYKFLQTTTFKWFSVALTWLQLAGWGKTEQGTPSDVLKWASQKFVQYDDCKKLIAPKDMRLVTHDKFCADQVKGKDTR